MDIDQLVQQVAPEWAVEFRRFVDTGDASEEFLAYMDKDEACQRAIDLAFTAQASAFEGLAAALHAAPVEPSSQGRTVEAVSSEVEAVLAATSALNADEQEELVGRLRASAQSHSHLRAAIDMVAKALADSIAGPRPAIDLVTGPPSPSQSPPSRPPRDVRR